MCKMLSVIYLLVFSMDHYLLFHNCYCAYFCNIYAVLVIILIMSLCLQILDAETLNILFYYTMNDTRTGEVIYLYSRKSCL